jgi:pilus assembly protein CpaF
LGVIEDDKELMLLDLRKGTDTFELASRPPNTEGLGEIGMDRLIRDALRMNANRMIVGEVRGKEAHYMLKAMSSGWNGSACTIHAEAAEDVLPQLIGYVFEHEDAPRDEEQVAKKVGRSIHLIVFLRAIRLADGRERRVMDKVVAVHGWASGEIALKPIIEYDELHDEWFWITGQAGEIADENWRRRFRNANIDLDDLVPHDIIERGNKYYAEQEESGYA